MDTKSILCPLTQKNISEYDCYIISEAAEGNVPENEMPCIQSYDIEKEICLKCKFHNID